MPSRAIRSSPVLASSPNTASTSGAPSEPSLPIRVRTKSCRQEAISIPERGEGSGKLGNDHLRNEDLAGDGAGVQRAAAAKGDQRRVAGIHALVDRDRAHRERHRGIGDPDDAERRVAHAQMQRIGDSLPDGALGGRHVEQHVAVQEAPRIDPSKDQIGVRHHRVEIALAVAGRARDRRPRFAGRHGCRHSHRPRRWTRRRPPPRQCRRPEAASADRSRRPPIT